MLYFQNTNKDISDPHSLWSLCMSHTHTHTHTHSYTNNLIIFNRQCRSIFYSCQRYGLVCFQISFIFPKINAFDSLFCTIWWAIQDIKTVRCNEFGIPGTLTWFYKFTYAGVNPKARNSLRCVCIHSMAPYETH